MSEPTDPGTARRSNAPLVVAAVLVLVAAALTVFLVHLRSQPDGSCATGYGGPGPTSQEFAAVQAAATEAANLTSYTRASFQHDFARALEGATGHLRADVARDRTRTLQVMNQGKYDLVGKVVEAAYESSTCSRVLVLVTLNGSHEYDKGTPLTTSQRVELTMVRANGEWLAINLSQVGAA